MKIKDYDFSHLPEFKPFSDLKNISVVQEFPEFQRAFYINKAEEFHENFVWKHLRASEYMEFFKGAPQVNFDKLYAEKRQALSILALAECFEGQGRFINSIVDGIWNICEESSWVTPVHSNHYHKDPTAYNILPDVEEEEPFIDLCTAETACTLAWIDYLLGEQLDEVTPLIRKRIAYELERRVLSVYLRCDGYGWMGFKRSPIHLVNNWNPWIHSNCLACFLLLEKDSERKAQYINKMLKSLTIFLEEYGEDGGCDEGPTYWTVAAGALFDCLELLYQATDGEFSLYDQPLIKNMASYIQKMHIADRYFANFADGFAQFNAPSDMIHRFGKRVGDENLACFGSEIFMHGDKDNLPVPNSMNFRFLCFSSNYRKYLNSKSTSQNKTDAWIKDIQVMVSRQSTDVHEGLCLAAKGGHNGENHNHNDVGSFIVYYKGLPVLIDLGVETYTAKTFSPRRYEIWTMQSQFHNLPTVNGIMQMNGREYAASEAEYVKTNEVECFSLNLKNAYPKEAGIESWKREFTFDRTKRAITVEDSYHLSKADNTIELNLMCCQAPEIDKGCIVFANQRGERIYMDFDPNVLGASIETFEVTDVRLKQDWGNMVYRLVLQVQDAVNNVQIRLEIHE